MGRNHSVLRKGVKVKSPSCSNHFPRCLFLPLSNSWGIPFGKAAQDLLNLTKNWQCAQSE
ncbi:hypothetical protein PEDI_38930 [Persicobacter diffluens]|uniref:Uncharacterized protein n=1 Tax=Persicobacter diffluens TaxID=981 RepID=A0AAN5ANH9_9BACT|nr:hypothetical protein PEDI_38930 [Persicobacter diffluens]